MTITQIITAKLAEVGWSQSDLSRATNIPRQNLSPMLRGERPMRVQHLMVIDHALNLGLDYSSAHFDKPNPAVDG
jgi:transcriptional regulator with XRE-family HTH domain